MNFLKENKFLVVMAAVLLVFGAASLLVANSLGGRAEIGAKAYASMGKEIDSLASKGVNRDIVDAAKQRVQDMRNEAKKVAEESLLRNRRDYKVMSFVISGNTIPAFPINPEFKNDRATLKLLFPEQYRPRIKAIRETLDPTIPPTENEIQLAIARIAASVMPEKKEDRTKPVTPQPTMRSGIKRGGPGSMEGGAMGPGSMEGGAEDYRPPVRTLRGKVDTARRGTRTSDEQVAIEQQARITLVISKSEKGWIYADEVSPEGGAMHNALPSKDYDDDTLWLAQVGLWVQKDIIDVINLTNRQVQVTASAGQRGVAASAVKRLMSIDIRGYVLGGGGPGTIQYIDIGEKKTSKPVPQLTGRVCNTLYEVVHYDFTVVLPMRHLLRLQKNLMAQNYHTVLEVDVIRPTPSDMHYYGTDSVMEVTIVGEMLMLTDFTRGRWDKDAKDWDKNYPPLTPATFLEKMRDMDTGIVRDEDKKRLKPPTVASAG